MLLMQLSHIQSKGEVHQISWWQLGSLSWLSR